MPKTAACEQPPLFFAESLDTGTVSIELSGEEAKHILLSRRMKSGQPIVLTNGKGVVAHGNIDAIDFKATCLSVSIEWAELVEPGAVKLTLASAIAKGDRQSVMLNMAVQLGMDAYIPLLCDHSVVKYDDKMRLRWQRLLVSACKQSRQYHVPVIHEGCQPDELLRRSNPRCLLIEGDPVGRAIADIRSEINPQMEEIILLVGPEGGFSERESAAMQSQNVLKLRLSNQVLRTEAAAVSMLAAVNQLVWSIQK